MPNPKLSLTDLVDIVSKSGTPKATKVAEVKGRGDYDPRTDYYKPARDAVKETHKGNKGKQYLKDRLADVKDQKKKDNYKALGDGYSKWWGNKTIAWFDPKRASFNGHGVEVVVNPELGLQVDGVRYIVKLYFKGEALTKPRVQLITHVMETHLRATAPDGAVMAVFDIRKAKLHVHKPVPATMNAIVAAELAYVAALWPNLP